ncbi:MAG: hypothetical protein K0R94_1240 [Burkholderiales bacterium]|jgi:hypothetical protein|nr:hypothetical protein [Burkholderiales bacterium]
MTIKQVIIKVVLPIMMIGASNYAYTDEASMTINVTNLTTCLVTCPDMGCRDVYNPKKVDGYPVYALYKDTVGGPLVTDKLLQIDENANIKYSDLSASNYFSINLSKYNTGAYLYGYGSADPLRYNNSYIVQFIADNYHTDNPGLLLWSINPCATLK